MATFAQIESERKKSLRSVRRAERSLDTTVEVMERRILRLLDRKTVLQSKDAQALSTDYAELAVRLRTLEQNLRDFFVVVTS